MTSLKTVINKKIASALQPKKIVLEDVVLFYFFTSIKGYIETIRAFHKLIANLKSHFSMVFISVEVKNSQSH